MWLSQKMTRPPVRTEGLSAGTVTVGGAEADVLAAEELREVSAAAPGGFAWRPSAGDNVLVMKTEGGQSCILGELRNDSPAALQNGEICLYSAGGAKIVLHNDGRIELCGVLWINGAPYEPPQTEEET